MHKLGKYANLGGLSLALGLLIVSWLAWTIISTPSSHDKEQARIKKSLEDRAISEVTMRISRRPEFAAATDLSSVSYLPQRCIEPYGGKNQVGVLEGINQTTPEFKRVYLDFCVDTDTWEITPDNPLARQVTTDDSSYLDAQDRCFQLTDSANKIREKILTETYGETFLRVRPSGSDPSAIDFSCTSSFSFSSHTDQEPAVWQIFPNKSAKDQPLTAAAVYAQNRKP